MVNGQGFLQALRARSAWTMPLIEVTRSEQQNPVACRLRVGNIGVYVFFLISGLCCRDRVFDYSMLAIFGDDLSSHFIVSTRSHVVSSRLTRFLDVP